MKAILAFLAAALAPAVSSATLVEINLDASGRFEHRATVAPGKFLEICGKLKASERIAWEFHAAQPMDFNVHYHVGQMVEFPQRESGVSRLSGTFEAPVDQHYCWMWKNGGAAEAPLEVTMRRP